MPGKGWGLGGPEGCEGTPGEEDLFEDNVYLFLVSSSLSLHFLDSLILRHPRLVFIMQANVASRTSVPASFKQDLTHSRRGGRDDSKFV